MSGKTQPINSQLCPICLAALPTRTPRNSNKSCLSNSIKLAHDRCNEELATPECCDHTFCLSCIKEWSKVCTIFSHIFQNKFQTFFSISLAD